MSQLLETITCPVLPAPMAGGPTTPELVAAADAAGSFSALGLGTCSVDAAREAIAACAGTRFGANIFHPQRELTETELAAAQALAAEEGAVLGDVSLNFGWQDKLDAALEGGAAVLWSMFGVFSEDEVARIHDAGAEAWTTVTNPEEAQAAAARGIDVLCVQGPEAGGHRGVWDPSAEPDQRPLEELVAAVHQVTDLPLIAAGGLRTAEDVATALAWPGVKAVSCGSAFLLSEEAGTSEHNRGLLRRGGQTVSTRAFSGRYARGLETAYTRAHPDLPLVYPYLNALLKPRRAQLDADVDYCLVGVDVMKLGGGSVAEILAQLHPNGHE
ncbi:2-nitropropane dioxygenase [Corynebacterium sp. HMSC035E02]|uniref:nitronate monooxygenase n=1 Tax=Corynebacterium sp. HMSC035E02 TaxID=1715114 RepID=UPI0008A83264|nr:nitronate monooxygenase [Corynebacterium sp. HMSC035E02]OHO51618.1 2-nitropropane dioxygenase [Corynebacterium sp. HMSC035E02]